ncbi:hypothetical protein ACO0R3_000129 [Hanseniaspora guilliermondii]
MQSTTQNSQRSFRSSFKKHLPTKLRSQSNSSSFDSSISSSDDVMSVESISSMNRKLSKREKFRSFFSNSRNNTDSMSADSSTTDNEDCTSILSITSQGKIISKREKFKSFFSHSKKNSTLSSYSSGNDNDCSSVPSDTGHSKTSNKREKFKSLFSRSKSSPDSYSSDYLNTYYESCSSSSSINTQNKLSTRREKVSPYSANSKPQESASSDSSTVIDEETANAETSFQQKPKSSKREKIRTVFGYRQPYTKVYIESPKSTKSADVPKFKNLPKLLSRSPNSDTSYVFRMTDKELKIARRKWKLRVGCRWLSAIGVAVAVVIFIASTPLLPLTLPVSIGFSAVCVYMVCKNARRFWNCWKQSIHRCKHGIKDRYPYWRSRIKGFFVSSPECTIDFFEVLENRKKSGLVYPRPFLETPAQYCARNSLPEYDLTFDKRAYSVYSRTVHASSKRVLFSAMDVFLTDAQLLKKNCHVSFAEPIISMIVQPAVY